MWIVLVVAVLGCIAFFLTREEEPTPPTPPVPEPEPPILPPTKDIGKLQLGKMKLVKKEPPFTGWNSWRLFFEVPLINTGNIPRVVTVQWKDSDAWESYPRTITVNPGTSTLSQNRYTSTPKGYYMTITGDWEGDNFAKAEFV